MIPAHCLTNTVKKELANICSADEFFEDVRKIIWEMELVVAVKGHDGNADIAKRFLHGRNKNPDSKKKVIAQIDTAIKQMESYSPVLLGHMLRDDAEKAAKAYMYLLECLKKPYIPKKRNDRKILIENVYVLMLKHQVKINTDYNGDLWRLLEVIIDVSGVDYGLDRLIREVCEMRR